MNDQERKRLIRQRDKLLALAHNNTNENEAAAARNKAAALSKRLRGAPKEQRTDLFGGGWEHETN